MNRTPVFSAALWMTPFSTSCSWFSHGTSPMEIGMDG
jgi:hypothetical protein